MRKFLALIIILTLFAEPAFAASTKPTPKSSTKNSTKSPAKNSLNTSKKVTTHTYHRKYVRNYVKPIPSPDPLWPPPNFSHNGSVYAKVPTADELKGAASNSKVLTDGLKNCEVNTCGAVFVASESGCNFWEVDSVISQVSATDSTSKNPIGTLRTLDTGSSAKKIKTILLISQAPLAAGISVGGISAKCWQSSPGDSVPSNTYTPIAPHN